MRSRFPAAFRPPAFASRVILFPPRDWAFLTVGLPPTSSGRTPSGFPRSTLTRFDRVGCLLYPGDGGAHPGPDAVPGQRLPLHNGVSLHSATAPHHGATIHEASTKVHAIHPSGLPLARDPRMGREVLRLSPRASHPAVTSNARQGRGQASSTRPELRCRRHVGPPNCEFTRKVRPRVATAGEGMRCHVRVQWRPAGVECD